MINNYISASLGSSVFSSAFVSASFIFSTVSLSSPVGFVLSFLLHLILIQGLPSYPSNMYSSPFPSARYIILFYSLFLPVFLSLHFMQGLPSSPSDPYSSPSPSDTTSSSAFFWLFLPSPLYKWSPNLPFGYVFFPSFCFVSCSLFLYFLLLSVSYVTLVSLGFVIPPLLLYYFSFS